jgi:hypothetical protein
MKKLHLKLLKIKVVIIIFSSFFSIIFYIMDSHSDKNEKIIFWLPAVGSVRSNILYCC